MDAKAGEHRRSELSGLDVTTTSSVSQESYLTTGMLPYKHSSFFPPTHGSIMLLPRQTRVFARLSRWQLHFIILLFISLFQRSIFVNLSFISLLQRSTFYCNTIWGFILVINILTSFLSCKHSLKKLGRAWRNIGNYYMEESVLLGTKPLVHSIRHFIRDPSGVFSVCHLCECRFVQWRHDSRLLLLLNWFLHIIKRTLHVGSKIWILC